MNLGPRTLLPASVGGGAAATTFGLPVAFALLLCCEGGVPVPVPADLVMIAVGSAVSAGSLPLWAAVLAVEAVGIAGTTALLLAARGPARLLLDRLGPRVGLSPQRLARASDVVERRGRGALMLGRTTPGLRTVTVVAAALSAVPARRALPALVAGSTIFLQAHLLLGFAIAAPARALLRRSEGPALVALAALVVAAAALAVWLMRRRRGRAPAWIEGSCPACLAATLLLERQRVRS